MPLIRFMAALVMFANNFSFFSLNAKTRRLFKDSTGISIREYARKRRLVFAAKRLQKHR